MKQNIIYRATETPFRYEAWPSVCADEKGVLYAVCSGHRVAHICPFGMNLLFKSYDGGDTWSLPMIANDTWGDDRDAGICYLGNGRLLLTYFHHPHSFYTEHREEFEKSADRYSRGLYKGMIDDMIASYTPETDTPGSFVKISDDCGLTFRDPIKVPITAPHGPVLTPSGRLLYLGKEFYGLHDPDDAGQIFLYESFDRGESWEKIAKLPLPEDAFPENVHEPHLAELPDGTLLGALRVENVRGKLPFTICFTRSYDRGKSWTKPEYSGISGSPAHLLLLRNGSLLCSYGRREAPYGIRAVVSGNGFLTHSEEMILSSAPNGDLGYPASVELPDGQILTVYYQLYGNDSRTSLLCTRWKL